MYGILYPFSKYVLVSQNPYIYLSDTYPNEFDIPVLTPLSLPWICYMFSKVKPVIREIKELHRSAWVVRARDVNLYRSSSNEPDNQAILVKATT